MLWLHARGGVWWWPHAPEVAADVQRLVVAVEHVDGAALLPRLLVEAPQEVDDGCRAREGEDGRRAARELG